MKTPVIFSLDVDLITDLRTLAINLGVPYSALAGRLLSVVQRPDALHVLTPWATAHKAAKVGNARGGGPELKASERLALSAVTGTWQTHKEIGAKTTQSEGVVWRALEGLRAKGVIEGGGTPGTVEIRGRPKHSQWRKARGAA